MWGRAALFALVCAIALLACTTVAGLEDLSFVPSSTGGSGATTSTTTTGADAGSGGGGTRSGGGGGNVGGSAGNAGTGGGGGGPDESTVVVRYFIDEADSGTAPIQLIDSSLQPLALALDYGGGNMTFGSTIDGRGLTWALGGGADGAFTTAGSKIRTRLDGLTTCTMELVIDVHDLTLDCSRFIHIGDPTTDGSLGVCATPWDIELRLGERAISIADHALGDDSLVVLHAVVDTAGTLPALDRGLIYVDGLPQQNTASTMLASPDETIAIALTDQFYLGNRGDNARSVCGYLHYAAVYDVAFDLATIGQRVVALSQQSDR